MRHKINRAVKEHHRFYTVLAVVLDVVRPYFLPSAASQCWGHNDNGQLGLGDDVDRGTTPASLGANLPAVELGAGDVPTAVDCGSLFTCVLLDDNSIKVGFRFVQL